MLRLPGLLEGAGRNRTGPVTGIAGEPLANGGGMGRRPPCGLDPARFPRDREPCDNPPGAPPAPPWRHVECRVTGGALSSRPAGAVGGHPPARLRQRGCPAAKSAAPSRSSPSTEPSGTIRRRAPYSPLIVHWLLVMHAGRASPAVPLPCSAGCPGVAGAPWIPGPAARRTAAQSGQGGSQRHHLVCAWYSSPRSPVPGPAGRPGERPRWHPLRWEAQPGMAGRPRAGLRRAGCRPSAKQGAPRPA